MANIHIYQLFNKFPTAKKRTLHAVSLLITFLFWFPQNDSQYTTSNPYGRASKWSLRRFHFWQTLSLGGFQISQLLPYCWKTSCKEHFLQTLPTLLQTVLYFFFGQPRASRALSCSIFFYDKVLSTTGLVQGRLHKVRCVFQCNICKDSLKTC